MGVGVERVVGETKMKKYIKDREGVYDNVRDSECCIYDTSEILHVRVGIMYKQSR